MPFATASTETALSLAGEAPPPLETAASASPNVPAFHRPEAVDVCITLPTHITLQATLAPPISVGIQPNHKKEVQEAREKFKNQTIADNDAGVIAAAAKAKRGSAETFASRGGVGPRLRNQLTELAEWSEEAVVDDEEDDQVGSSVPDAEAVREDTPRFDFEVALELELRLINGQLVGEAQGPCVECKEWLDFSAAVAVITGGLSQAIDRVKHEARKGASQGDL